MSGVSEAFYHAMLVIGSRAQITPLPKGLTTVEAGDWTLTINVGIEPLHFDGGEVPPYTVLAKNNVYFVFGLVAPDGGMIGGMTEDEFIRQMKELAPEDAA